MDGRQALLPEPRGGGWLTALVIGGGILCALIVKPFLPALTWAVVLTLLAAPLEASLRRRIGRAWASSAITVTVVALAIVGPALLVSNALLGELVSGAGVVQRMLSPEHWQAVARTRPVLAPTIHWATANVDFDLLLETLSGRIASMGEDLLQGSVNSVAILLLTLYFLFYLLRDGAWFRTSIVAMLPLSAPEAGLLNATVRNTILASFYGTIAVAALQGFLAGAMFWWLDLPSPVFWGIIMGMLAVVPFLGAFVIWAPAALALAIDGEVGSAALLTAWGLLVVGLIDNVVYPILVGRRIAMHSLVSFIAIIGGLVLFGAHGIVLGPVCVATTQALIRIRHDRVAAET